MGGEGADGKEAGAIGGGKGLYIRIPSWATAATVTVNGVVQPGHPTNGTMHFVPPPPSSSSSPTTLPSASSSSYSSSSSSSLVVELDLNPSIRLEEWYEGSVSVHRGALMYVNRLYIIYYNGYVAIAALSCTCE